MTVICDAVASLNSMVNTWPSMEAVGVCTILLPGLGLGGLNVMDFLSAYKLNANKHSTTNKNNFFITIQYFSFTHKNMELSFLLLNLLAAKTLQMTICVYYVDIQDTLEIIQGRKLARYPREVSFLHVFYVKCAYYMETKYKS